MSSIVLTTAPGTAAFSLGRRYATNRALRAPYGPCIEMHGYPRWSLRDTNSRRARHSEPAFGCRIAPLSGSLHGACSRRRPDLVRPAYARRLVAIQTAVAEPRRGDFAEEDELNAGKLERGKSSRLGGKGATAWGERRHKMSARKNRRNAWAFRRSSKLTQCPL